MKILIVNPSFWIYGGAERLIVRLCNYLTEKYVQTTILTTKILPKIKEDLTETRIIETSGLAEMAIWMEKIHLDFDVVNFHNYPAPLLSIGKHTPNVWMCNEPPQIYLEGGKIPEREIELIQKFIKKAVVADEFNQKRFKKIYNMDSEIINYGVDYDALQKGDGSRFRKKYEIPDDAFLIYQIGFIHPLKNQMETIKTFKEVKNKIPNAKLIFAGHDKLSYVKEVKDYMFKNNLQADVIFTGEIPYNEIRDLHNAGDVFFAPIKTQGGWLSIFDAIACGKQVVVSEEATCSQIIRDNGLGYIGNYIENILKINKEPQTDYREWVKKNLSWEKFSEKMLEVFKCVCS